MNTIYIVQWSWTDKAAGGLVRAFASKDKAQACSDLLTLYGGDTRTFDVVDLCYDEEGGKGQ